jgi:tetratricopeptide (TPR) repeat protein
MKRKSTALSISLVLLSASAFAQSAVRLPDASPAAETGQTIGITDVTVRYHRPAVNKRKIWNGQVPYGVVWRAGANENTTISFSTPVKIEGKDVPAGTYALYVIPNAGPWNLVLSRFASDWGAYNYDPSEDVLRAAVTPRPMPESQDRLSYTFEDLGKDSAPLVLRWEKLSIPIRIQVDVTGAVRASIEAELRGGKHWNPDAWAAAARWELRNGDLEAALRDADRAVETGTTLTALRTKAAVLEKKGDARGAAELRARANSVANEAETIAITVGPMLGEKKYDEAIAWLSGYASKHPESRELWRVHAFLGDAYSGKKQADRARAEYEKAMAGAHDNSERTEVQDSINTVRAEGE